MKTIQWHSQTRDFFTTWLGLFAFGLTMNQPYGVLAGEAKPDPTGTWKWSFTTQNGDTIAPVLKLKLDGDKLAGTITGRDGSESAIENGKLNGEEVSFKVTRERDGQKFTLKYSGKLNGDTITGKTEFERDGESRSRDWEAKREKATESANASGTWKWSFTPPGGDAINASMKLKQEGEKVTGTYSSIGPDAQIDDGKLKGNDLSFKVTREFGGQKFVVSYAGKLNGDGIIGKAETSRDGESVSWDWDAKKVKE